MEQGQGQGRGRGRGLGLGYLQHATMKDRIARTQAAHGQLLAGSWPKITCIDVSAHRHEKLPIERRCDRAKAQGKQQQGLGAPRTGRCGCAY